MSKPSDQTVPNYVPSAADVPCFGGMSSSGLKLGLPSLPKILPGGSMVYMVLSYLIGTSWLTIIPVMTAIAWFVWLWAPSPMSLIAEYFMPGVLSSGMEDLSTKVQSLLDSDT